MPSVIIAGLFVFSKLKHGKANAAIIAQPIRYQARRLGEHTVRRPCGKRKIIAGALPEDIALSTQVISYTLADCSAAQQMRPQPGRPRRGV